MTAISVTDYVLSVISDSKYGGDIEWVKANLDPRHVRRIEAEYTRQQREEAWEECFCAGDDVVTNPYRKDLMERLKESLRLDRKETP